MRVLCHFCCRQSHSSVYLTDFARFSTNFTLCLEYISCLTSFAGNNEDIVFEFSQDYMAQPPLDLDVPWIPPVDDDSSQHNTYDSGWILQDEVVPSEEELNNTLALAEKVMK